MKTKSFFKKFLFITVGLFAFTGKEIRTSDAPQSCVITETLDDQNLLAMEEGIEIDKEHVNESRPTRLQKFLASRWYPSAASFVGGLIPFAAGTATKPAILESKIDAAAAQSIQASSARVLALAALRNGIIMAAGNAVFYVEPFTGLESWTKVILIAASQLALHWGIVEKTIKTAQKEALVKQHQHRGINPYDYKKAAKEAKAKKKKNKA